MSLKMDNMVEEKWKMQQKAKSLTAMITLQGAIIAF